MALQKPGRVTGVNRALHFYVPVEVAVDSLFPFSADDPFVLRAVPSAPAVVFSPPTCKREQIELPAIESAVRQEAREL